MRGCTKYFTYHCTISENMLSKNNIVWNTPWAFNKHQREEISDRDQKVGHPHQYTSLQQHCLYTQPFWRSVSFDTPCESDPEYDIASQQCRQLQRHLVNGSDRILGKVGHHPIASWKTKRHCSSILCCSSRAVLVLSYCGHGSTYKSQGCNWETECFQGRDWYSCS